MEELEKYINELIVVGGVILGVWVMGQTAKLIISTIKEVKKIFSKDTAESKKVQLVEELSERIHKTYHKVGNIQQENAGILHVIMDVKNKLDGAKFDEIYNFGKSNSESQGAIAAALVKLSESMDGLNKTTGLIAQSQTHFNSTVLTGQGEIKQLINNK